MVGGLGICTPSMSKVTDIDSDNQGPCNVHQAGGAGASSVRGGREGNDDLVALLRKGQLALILELPEDAPPLVLVRELALERLGGVKKQHLDAQHGAIEGAPLLKLGQRKKNELTCRIKSEVAARRQRVS